MSIFTLNGSPLYTGQFWREGEAGSSFPTDGLISYWDFNDNANDIYGSNNCSTRLVSYDTGIKENNKCAYLYRGTTTTNGSAIWTAYDSISTSQIGNGGSVSYWIKIPYIIYAGWFFSIEGWVDNNRGNYSQRIKTLSDGTAYGSEIPVDIADDEWHHIVFTWDTSKNYTYIDGSSAYETSTTRGPDPDTTTSRYMTIGAQYNINATRTMTGCIDEFGIWSRKLTDQEASDLWNNGNGLFYTP